MGGFALNPMGPTTGMLARLAGKIVTVWCVRRWGNITDYKSKDAVFSQSTGQAWSFKGYFVAWLASYLGGEIVARAVGQKAGEDFYQGGIDLTATKLMWSELVQRWEPAREALGRTGGGYSAQLSQLAMGATEGDILDDGGGNRWLLQNGRWVSMQGAGAMGRLVEADYLGQEEAEGDGYEDEDESEGAGMGRLVEADYLGHMMPPGATTQEESYQAQYQRRGSSDPYHAAYL